MKKIFKIIIIVSSFIFMSTIILAQPIKAIEGEGNIVVDMVRKRGIEGAKFFHEATGFISKNEYDKAIESCEKVLIINPDDYEVNFLLGYSYSKKGDFQKAIEYYQKSTNVYPNQIIIIAMLAVFKDDQNYLNKLNKTIEYYKNEIAKNPNNYKAYNDLGYISFILKMEPKFEEYFKKSIEIKPEYAQAHYNLALYYFYNGNNAHVLEEYNILEKLDKNLAKVILRIIGLAEKSKK